MVDVDWRLEGDWIKNCNCAFGCPRDFNASPTEGECRGLLGMRIASGHFGDVTLDGLSFFITVAFPGPLHEGNGAAQPIIDERASPDQRAALLAIMSGKHSADGTIFHICSLIVTTMHEPVFAPIRVSFDMENRTACVEIPGVLETDVEPIRNPITGAPHRIRVEMPDGFEHRAAEVASPNIVSSGAIRSSTRGRHSSLARVVQTQNGVAA